LVESVGFAGYYISIVSPYLGTATDAGFKEAFGVPSLLEMAASLIECGQVVKRI
jgi:hypothetical protein